MKIKKTKCPSCKQGFLVASKTSASKPRNNSSPWIMGPRLICQKCGFTTQEVTKVIGE